MKLPPFATVHDAFAATVARHSDRPFLRVLSEVAGIYGIPAGDVTYGEAGAEVERLSRRYAAAGFGHGHRAGLLLENRPAFFFHWLALNSLGISVVPINPDWRAAELEYLVDNSEISLAVVPGERIPGLEDAARTAGRPLIAVTPDTETLPAAPFAPPASGAPGVQTEAALLYTSGTTGRPKGCILPNEYFLLAGQWYRTIGGMVDVREGEDVLISPLPLVHMNAMAYSSMVMMMTGGCIVILDRFHPRSWWDAVRDSGATIVHYLGVMPAMLLGAEPSAQDKAHAVRFGFGAGVDRRHHAVFEDRFGFPLLEAWAMTETGAGAVIIANREPRHVGTSCFGRVEDRIEYRVLDDDGNDAPQGELLVRARGDDPTFGFFKGYLKNPDATAEAWDGGWFHTGDIVSVDAAGDFRFVDRKKNVIRRSGENISAVEVEGVLLQHPAVASVGVAAVPDPVRGDEVMAVVVPHSPVPADQRAAVANSLVAHCLDRLAYYKAPGYVVFADALPLTPTQKIQRADLKALAAASVDSDACVDTRSLKKRQVTA